jgi:hypothetical protein
VSGVPPVGLYSTGLRPAGVTEPGSLGLPVTIPHARSISRPMMITITMMIAIPTQSKRYRLLATAINQSVHAAN